VSIELKVLGWSVCLGLLHLAIAATLATQQRGLKWNAGNRDGEVKVLTGMAARADRASRNFLETFAFFVAAVLAVFVLGRSNSQTVFGSELYFWARLAYLAVYLIGIPYLRTVVWAAAMAGMGVLIVQWL
jgi:uncharacterized MAPEG superfamily protein